MSASAYPSIPPANGKTTKSRPRWRSYLDAKPTHSQAQLSQKPSTKDPIPSSLPQTTKAGTSSSLVAPAASVAPSRCPSPAQAPAPSPSASSPSTTRRSSARISGPPPPQQRRRVGARATRRRRSSTRGSTWPTPAACGPRRRRCGPACPAAGWTSSSTTRGS